MSCNPQGMIVLSLRAFPN